MCKCRNVTVKPVKASPKMKRRSSNTNPGFQTDQDNFDLAVYFLVISAAVISYWNSLDGEFVHDDIPAIVTNGDVTGAKPLRQLFCNDFWGTPMWDVTSHKSYRPLTTLFFRLNHAVSAAPWCWHACNIFLHASCCALVARACVQVARLRRPFAAFAALLFAVHPVHTEAVAGIVGRADLLACIFFLLSLLVYHGNKNKKKKVWFSILLGALSMHAKETGLAVFIFNIAYDFYRHWPRLQRSVCKLRVERGCSGLSVRTVKVVLSFALLVSFRLALLHGTLPAFSPQDNPAAFHPSLSVRLMTFCYLAAFNWWLLLCPWVLSHDWQMGSVPLLTTWWDPRNLLTCAALGALLLLCYRCATDILVQKHLPAVVGLMLLVIPFVPASNLFVTVGFVVAERVLYIPSVGSVIITAYGAQLVWGSKPGSRVLLVFAIVTLTVSGAARTWRRSADWKDRATLLRADLASLPQNAKLHYNYGNYLREAEQPDLAIQHYIEALRLWPSYASAHNNLGTLLVASGGAEHHFLQAIAHNRYHVNAHYNLGKLYKKSGKNKLAVDMLEKCISLQPTFTQAYIDLLTLKSDLDALRILRKLVLLEPNNWEHRVLFGNWFRNKGLLRLASSNYVEAMKLSLRSSDTVSTVRGDLISLRSAALTFRSLGQKSRILQILLRWHTWRRGWPSAVSHVYLREWHLRQELRNREKIYSNAANPKKKTTCFDHNQLSVSREVKKEEKSKTIKSNRNPVNGDGRPCDCDRSQKRRRASVASQLKTTHNKSEIGIKAKKCCPQVISKHDSVSELSAYMLIKTF